MKVKQITVTLFLTESQYEALRHEHKIESKTNIQAKDEIRDKLNNTTDIIESLVSIKDVDYLAN